MFKYKKKTNTNHHTLARTNSFSESQMFLESIKTNHSTNLTPPKSFFHVITDSFKYRPGRLLWEITLTKKTNMEEVNKSRQ